MQPPANSAEPVLNALLERRTIHAYRRDPVDSRAVERALEAAIHAPNHRMTIPWRFVRVGRTTRARLAEIAVRLRAKPGVPVAPPIADEIRSKLLDPPELIVVAVVRQPDPAIAREDYASAACAIQNLSLALFAQGIGSKWSTAKVASDAETYTVLGIDPAQQEIIGFVTAGLPAAVPATPPRPALDTLVRVLP